MIIQNIETIPLTFNLLCHITVFFTTFYVAMHNRFINPVILTMLWYVGLSSFFVSSTIGIEYLLGKEFELSYTNLGSIAEIVSNLSVTVTLCIIFMLTVNEDFRAKTRRDKQPRKTTRRRKS